MSRPAETGAALLALALLASGCGEAREAAPAADGPRVLALAAGGDVSFATFSHGCAVVAGAIQCWGANGFGQLGDGSPSTRVPLPVRVGGVPEPARALAAGGAHTCALAGGRVWCWGNNTAHQLGSERAALEVVPRPVEGLPVPVADLAAGDRHTCAVAAGAVWCWGLGFAGEGGHASPGRCRGLYGAQPCAATPARVAGLEAGARAVALGAGHGCALLDGAVRCWGRGDRGQRGGGAGSGAGPALALPGPAAALAAGADHTCARVDGAVWCWGANASGQLGDGSREDRPEPVRVGLAGEVRALAAGRAHSCALGAAGRVWCWGSNAEGQVGGTQALALRPVRVPLSGPATAIAAGSDVSCAALATGGVACWGDNDYGQLGGGDAPRDHAGPAAVGAWDDGRLRDVDGDGRLAVACLGDSNTAGAPRPLRGWCERLEERLNDGAGVAWRSVNRGQGGASAVPASLRPARQALAYTLENDRPDVVILAYGTNDLLGGASPEEVLLALLQHRQRARSAAADVFVALTPPAWPASREVNGPIRALNELIRTALPAPRVIDFHTGFGAADFEDGIHLNEAGQERRARVAAEALRAAAAAEPR